MLMRTRVTPQPPTTTDYLRAIGRVFQACRGSRSVADIARGLQGHLARATIERLERGAPDVSRTSEIALATFYGLTLAALHEQALAAIGAVRPPDGELTLTFRVTAQDRDEILRALEGKRTTG